MKIESYYYGFIVVDHDGVALSRTFKTEQEANNFMQLLERTNENDISNVIDFSNRHKY